MSSSAPKPHLDNPIPDQTDTRIVAMSNKHTTISMIDLAARHRRVAKQTEELVLKTLRSGQYTDGELVSKAEARFATRFDRTYGCGVASGTDALILGLMALGVGPDDEVILPALSFFATVGAVLSIGARPVIVDVGDEACIDPEATERAITPRTKAIIPVHLYGNYAKLPDFQVPILDDSAQAIGGRPARSFGHLSAVSVYPTKTLGSAGSGGFVVGDDPVLIERVRRLGRHGYCTERGEHHRVGAHIGRNSRLDAIQAAVILAHDTDLERRVARRQQTAERYDQHLPHWNTCVATTCWQPSASSTFSSTTTATPSKPTSPTRVSKRAATIRGRCIWSPLFWVIFTAPMPSACAKSCWQSPFMPSSPTTKSATSRAVSSNFRCPMPASAVIMILFQFFALAIGAVLGSFSRVCITRWPHDRSVITPRSQCPQCATPITAFNNIPIFSWFLMRGKAKCCGATISIEYPLTEAIGSSLAWLLFQRFIPTIAELDAPHLIAWAFYTWFAMMLVIAAMVDLRHRIIPDEVTIYAVPLGLVGILVLNLLGYDGWLAITWQNAALGAGVTGGFMAALSIGFLYVFDREGLGWGDVKLLAAIGAFLGFLPGSWFVLMFGSLLGSFVGITHLLATRRRAYLPFGPSLALSAIAYVLFGDSIIETYFPTLAGWL